MPFQALPCGCTPKFRVSRCNAMWSAQQQTMLNAMGYTLYVRPQARPEKVTEQKPEPQNQGAKSPPDSLLFAAIMKVVHGRDVSQLGIDFDALRSSPHAKRTLWPQLRRVIKS